MNLSYREKSLWVSLLVSLIITSYFGNKIVALFSEGATANPGAVSALLLKIIIASVIVEVVLHTLLAMSEQDGANEPEDEREKLFRLQANEWGYWFLAVGVITCIVHELINKQLTASADTLSHSAYQQFGFAPLELKLVAIFWISEIIRFSAQLYFYRKGE